ncbi:MAG: hypothetical protein EOP05_06395, partial [Proteobacteria bacterium]
IESLRELTANLSEEDLHLLFDMCLKGTNDLLRAQDSRIVLEMLLLRMAAAPRIASLAALASGAPIQISQARGTTSHAPRSAAPSSGPGAVAAMPPAQTAPQAPESAPAAAPEGEKKYSMASFTRPAAGQYGAPSEPAPAPAPKPAAAQPAAQASRPHDDYDDAPKVDPSKASDPWYQFVSNVKKSNSLLGAMLENTHHMSTEGTKLTIGVPKKMSFMFDKVKDPENIKRIESFIETFWNKKYEVDVKLADEGAQKATPKAMAEERKAEVKRSVETAVEQDPLVQAAQNAFKGQIKAIKETRGRRDET